MIRLQDNSRFSKIYTFLLITMPITNMYQSPLPGIGIGEIIFLLIMPYMLIKLNKNLRIEKNYYWMYFLYAIVTTLLVSLFQKEIDGLAIILKLCRDGLYVCIFLLFAKHYFDIEYGFKTYKLITIIVTTYLFLQIISFNVFNYTLPWVIENLPINYAGLSTHEYILKYERMYKYAFRPTSIFLEPAHFGQYIIPCLILLLFPYKKGIKIDIKLAIYISLALALTTSTSTVILMMIVWGIWIYTKKDNDKKKFFRVIKVIGYLLFFFGSIYLCFFDENFKYLLSRLGEIVESGSSGNLRVTRGFQIWANLPLEFQVFGIGFGNYETFSVLYSIDSILGYQVEISDYMSTISAILVHSGIIGLFLFAKYLMKSYLKSTDTGKCLIVVMLIMFLGASMYSSPVYAISMAFIIYLPKNNKQIKRGI